MFRVPTYIAPSPIAGMGVFSAGPIPAGTVIWTFTEGVDLRLPKSALVGIPEPLGSMIRSYCFEEPDGTLVLCGDHARFMNHSFEPNCDDSGDATRTARDIEAGEELTCDYRSFDEESRRSGLLEWSEASTD